MYAYALCPFRHGDRVVRVDDTNDQYLIQGDASITCDGWFQRDELLAELVHIERGGRPIHILRVVFPFA